MGQRVGKRRSSTIGRARRCSASSQDISGSTEVTPSASLQQCELINMLPLQWEGASVQVQGFEGG